MSDDLVKRLREESLNLHGSAWRNQSGGQESTMSAVLAEEAAAHIAALEAAIAPFSRMAGLMFSINKNSSDVVLSIKANAGEDQLTAGDFFAARAALESGQ